MGIFLFLTTEIIYIVSIYICMNLFFKSKKTSGIFEKSAYICLLVVNISISVTFNVPIVIFIVNIIYIFSLTFLYESSMRVRTIYFSLIVMIFVVVEIFSYIMFSNMGTLDYFSANTLTNECIEIAVSISRLGIVFVIYKIYKKDTFLYGRDIIPRVYSFYFSVICIFILSTMFLASNKAKTNDKFAILIISISVIAICIILFKLFYKTTLLIYENSNKKILDKQVEYYTEQLRFEKENSDEIKKIRHDIKNHLFSIKNLIEEQKKEDAIIYIEKIISKINIKKRINTGNSIIDGMLNLKLEQLEKVGTKIEVNIFIPFNITIAQDSMTIILGNLLDNMIEGVLTTDCDRSAKIIMKYIDSSLIINFQNTFDGNIISDKNGFVSRKNRLGSGFGIKNVIKEVESLGGNILIRPVENIFSVYIQLPN